MIEIVFGDSAAGSLKIAQSYGKGPYRGSAMSVILRKPDGSTPTKKEIQQAKRQAQEADCTAWEEAVPLGGSPQDVFCFDLKLSIGDISENLPGPKRLRTLEKLAGIYPDEVTDSMRISDMLHKTETDFFRLSQRIAAGEAARIWYSSKPDELCGLIWFAAQLSLLEDGKNACAPLYAVRLPLWGPGQRRAVVSKTCWGEILPEEWHRYLSLQETLPAGFGSACLSLWQDLQKENAPLRAVINGRLVSVPENFYDSFIQQEISAEEAVFHEAKLIGKVLGKYQLGVSDALISLRIDEMIRRGELGIISQAEKGMPVYHRMLKIQSPGLPPPAF